MNDNTEKRICQNCRKDFIIEPGDFGFYEKMEVLAPIFCPQCGLNKLTLLRNERIVYWDECDKCGKKNYVFIQS